MRGWSYHADVVAVQQDLGQLGGVAVIATRYPSQQPECSYQVRGVRSSLFSHILEDNVDVVVKPQQRTTELYEGM